MPLLVLLIFAVLEPLWACDTYFVQSGQNRKPGYLFSAYRLEQSKLAHYWSQKLPELKKHFPQLKFTKPEDLHITTVYIGEPSSGTIHEAAGVLEAQSFPPISLADVRAKRIRKFGSGHNIVVVELLGLPRAIQSEVLRLKRILVDRGFIEEDERHYRPHITLARLKRGREAKEEVEGLADWAKKNIPLHLLQQDPEARRAELLIAGGDYLLSGEGYISYFEMLNRFRSAIELRSD